MGEVPSAEAGQPQARGSPAPPRGGAGRVGSEAAGRLSGPCALARPLGRCHPLDARPSPSAAARVGPRPGGAGSLPAAPLPAGRQPTACPRGRQEATCPRKECRAQGGGAALGRAGPGRERPAGKVGEPPAARRPARAYSRGRRGRVPGPGAGRPQPGPRRAPPAPPAGGGGRPRSPHPPARGSGAPVGSGLVSEEQGSGQRGPGW